MTDQVDAPEQGTQGDDGGQAPAELSGAQKAASAEGARLKVEFLKADPGGDRDKLMLRIAECQRAEAGNGPLPAGLTVPGEPGKPDLRPYDPDVAAFERAQAADAITPERREEIQNHAAVNGLDREDAAAVVRMAEEFQLGASAAKVMSERVALHTREGWGLGKLSEADASELYMEAARQFGSEEALNAENALARAYAVHVGADKFIDEHAGSLALDKHLIVMFAAKARQLGLEPAKG